MPLLAACIAGTSITHALQPPSHLLQVLSSSYKGSSQRPCCMQAQHFSRKVCNILPTSPLRWLGGCYAASLHTARSWLLWCENSFQLLDSSTRPTAGTQQYQCSNITPIRLSYIYPSSSSVKAAYCALDSSMQPCWSWWEGRPQPPGPLSKAACQSPSSHSINPYCQPAV